MARRPTQDDKQIWKRVADTTTPLASLRPKVVVGVSPVKEAQKTIQPKPLRPFRIGANLTSETLARATTAKAAPVQMDAKSFTKLRRGKLRPEATLDLHGMTVDQAHPELVGFVMNAISRGFRLILVISGKGRLKEDYGFLQQQGGVLRRSVPMWLKQAPLGQSILEVTEAHQKHGGGGAFYVYLRRRRQG